MTQGDFLLRSISAAAASGKGRNPVALKSYRCARGERCQRGKPRIRANSDCVWLLRRGDSNEPEKQADERGLSESPGTRKFSKMRWFTKNNDMKVGERGYRVITIGTSYAEGRRLKCRVSVDLSLDARHDSRAISEKPSWRMP